MPCAMSITPINKSTAETVLAQVLRQAHFTELPFAEIENEPGC